MVIINSSITIDHDVESVRYTFLKFHEYPKWNSQFLRLIERPLRDTKMDALVSGDILKVEIVMPSSQKASVFYPTVLENSRNSFKWKGTLLSDWIFCGVHSFEFMPTEEDSKTIVRQSEEFSGILAWPLFKWIGKDTEKGFGEFNRSLKTHLEGLK